MTRDPKQVTNLTTITLLFYNYCRGYNCITKDSGMDHNLGISYSTCEN